MTTEIFGEENMLRNICLRSPVPCPVGDQSSRPELARRRGPLLEVTASHSSLICGCPPPPECLSKLSDFLSKQVRPLMILAQRKHRGVGQLHAASPYLWLAACNRCPPVQRRGILACMHSSSATSLSAPMGIERLSMRCDWSRSVYIVSG